MEGIRKALPIIGLLLMAIGLSMFGISYAGSLDLKENLENRMVVISLAVAAVGALFTLVGFSTRGFGPNIGYYLSYALSAIFIFGALAAAYIIVQNHSHTYDLTEVKMYSLHPRTIEYLQKLDKDVSITAFPSPDSKREIESFLERYTRFTPRIHFEVRNPYKDIKLAKSYAENISLGDIFVWTGTRSQPGEPKSPDYREKKLNAFSPRDLTETKLTNAIVEIMRPEKVTVYFLTGHGETSLESSGAMMGERGEGRPSYSLVQQVLRDEMSFGVKTLELARTGYVPDDCSLLICAGPSADLLPMEEQAIEKYLKGGGRGLFLLDPNLRLKVRFDQWRALMAGLGVKIAHDIVLEHSPFTQLLGGPTMLLVNRFGSHPTVENQNQMAQMNRVRTVAPLENLPSTLTVTALMYSSDRSWAQDIDRMPESGEIELPEAGGMKAQPLAVAVSGEASGESKKGLRMVVIGDSDVFEDQFLPNTVGLFANLVNWLTAREDLIDIPTKDLPNTPIMASRAQLRTVFVLLVLAFPGVIFFGGLGYVLVRRRVR